MNTAPQASSPTKAIMDWGYRHGLMLTKSQAEDLLKTIAGNPTEFYGLPESTDKQYGMDIGGGRRIPVSMGKPTPKGKYDGQPEHAQRGWQPK